MEPKYKVGDKVRVIEPPVGMYFGEESNVEYGEIGTIESIDEDGGEQHGFRIVTSKDVWWYDQGSFSLLSEESGIKVGDKVRITGPSNIGWLPKYSQMGDICTVVDVYVHSDGLVAVKLQDGLWWYEGSYEPFPKFKVGDMVRLLAPPHSMSWDCSDTHSKGTIGTVVDVDEGDTECTYKVDSEYDQWWYSQGSLELVRSMADEIVWNIYPPSVFNLGDEVDNTRVESAQEFFNRLTTPCEAPVNPKQLYGDKKVPLHLVPPSAMIYTALGLREGAEKYGAWNFREARVEAMTYIGAIQRHLLAWVDGENLDTDCKYAKPHLAGAMASLAILIDAIENDQVIDNRPIIQGRSVAATLLKKFTL